jgi:hypothetical protein
VKWRDELPPTTLKLVNRARGHVADERGGNAHTGKRISRRCQSTPLCRDVSVSSPMGAMVRREILGADRVSRMGSEFAEFSAGHGVQDGAAFRDEHCAKVESDVVVRAQA